MGGLDGNEPDGDEIDGDAPPRRAWRRPLIAGVSVAALAGLAAAYLTHARSSPPPTVHAPAPSSSAPASSAAATEPRAGAPSTSVNLDEARRLSGRYQVKPLDGSVVWHVTAHPNDPRLKRQVWGQNCKFYRACPKPRVLPHCKPGRTAATWESVRERAQSLQGTRVEISGKLDVGPPDATTAMWCFPPCCRRGGAPIVLDNREQDPVLENSSHALGLEGYLCEGDESKGCCNVLADGREVIATGRLEPMPGSIEMHQLVWQLRDLSVCVVTPAVTTR
jgi:hypothetical protein